jgi:hypothetical protein
MKRKLFVGALAAVTLLALASPWIATKAQESAAQFFFKSLKNGVQAQGANVLQIGEANTLSAAVASATTTQVVAAPASGSIYLRGIWIEKMTTATGLFNVITGTGTNCGTGTTTLLSQSLAAGQSATLGEYKIGIFIPAAQALCLQTDAATTSVRAFTN